MTINEFQQKASQIDLGKMVSAKWQSVAVINNDTYKKVSNGIVRFVRYENIQAVKDHKQQSNGKVQAKTNNFTYLIDNMLKYNNNTKNTLVQMAVMPNTKTTTTYYLNGEEITKEQYQMAIPPKTSSTPIVVFTPKLENVLEISQHHSN